jgi:large subunit ribosomal protein L4
MAQRAPAKSAARKTAIKAPKLGGTGNVDLPAELFGEPFHGPTVYEAARADQLARRRGTAATKTRAEVRGGGTKPWRQKGTGRARAGSIRAPHWTGGGTAFGPAPRSYTVKVNRKARRRALRAALSVHAEHGTVAIVDGAAFEEPSTSKAAEVLTGWHAKLPVLVLLAQEEETCAKSFRNIDSVNVVPASDAGVADVVGAASIVISAAALDALAELMSDQSKERSGDS